MSENVLTSLNSECDWFVKLQVANNMQVFLHWLPGWLRRSMAPFWWLFLLTWRGFYLWEVWITFLCLLTDMNCHDFFSSIMLGTQWASHSGDLGHSVLQSFLELFLPCFPSIVLHHCSELHISPPGLPLAFKKFFHAHFLFTFFP